VLLIAFPDRTFYFDSWMSKFNKNSLPPSFQFPTVWRQSPSPFGHAMDTIRRKILWSERADYERWTIKQLHIAATVTASAMAVFQFLRRDYSYSGAFVQFALKNRATVQIVVQVLAHILALLQIYSIRTSFNFAMRLYLKEKIASKSSQAISSESLLTPSHREGWNPD
jgi:hypothetical protein